MLKKNTTPLIYLLGNSRVSKKKISMTKRHSAKLGINSVIDYLALDYQDCV